MMLGFLPCRLRDALHALSNHRSLGRLSKSTAYRACGYFIEQMYLRARPEHAVVLRLRFTVKVEMLMLWMEIWPCPQQRRRTADRNDAIIVCIVCSDKFHYGVLNFPAATYVLSSCFSVEMQGSHRPCQHLARLLRALIDDEAGTGIPISTHSGDRSGGCRSSFRFQGAGEPLFWKFGLAELLPLTLSCRWASGLSGVITVALAAPTGYEHAARVVCVHAGNVDACAVCGVVKLRQCRAAAATDSRASRGCVPGHAIGAPGTSWRIRAMRDRSLQPIPTIQRRQGCLP
jgi:hypothetical protein